MKQGLHLYSSDGWRTWVNPSRFLPSRYLFLSSVSVETLSFQAAPLQCLPQLASFLDVGCQLGPLDQNGTLVIAFISFLAWPACIKPPLSFPQSFAGAGVAFVSRSMCKCCLLSSIEKQMVRYVSPLRVSATQCTILEDAFYCRNLLFWWRSTKNNIFHTSCPVKNNVILQFSPHFYS